LIWRKANGNEARSRGRLSDLAAEAATEWGPITARLSRLDEYQPSRLNCVNAKPPVAFPREQVGRLALALRVFLSLSPNIRFASALFGGRALLSRFNPLSPVNKPAK
jgi:hypothetical protein